MRQSQTIRQTTRQKADFRLIAATHILQKGAASLRQLIQEELAANPALELATDLLCPSCGFPLHKGECRFCSGLLITPNNGGDGGEQFLPSHIGQRSDKSLIGQSDIGETASPVSLAEHLRAQAHEALPTADHYIADYMVANIGEKGLLECELEEISGDLHVPLERLHGVLTALQGLEPLGVGSRSPQEALLSQIGFLSQNRKVDPWAEKLISSCWEDLAYRRYQRIARILGCSLEEVRKSVEFIRENLNPYPANAFSGLQQLAAPQGISWPDVIIHREKDGYRVEVVESYESELRISDSFLRLRRVLSGNGNPSSRSVHALESLRRACFFLACLKIRRKTLQDVTECVVDLQRGYLDTGMEENLRPLTRSKVAALLGKHESTISRAVADKFVLLPCKQLVPFDRFFAPGAGPKSIIRELVRREGKHRPLTDKEIRQILETRGYHLARRTVAKYRLLLQIPPSNQRRNH